MPVASGWYGFLSARVNTNDMQKSIESLKLLGQKYFLPISLNIFL